MNFTTNFASMNRDEIRAEITVAIGDSELPEDVREVLVLKLEDLDNVTPDEFWGHVEAAFSDYENTQREADNASNLQDMTVSELRKLAVEFGIAGRSTMKKAELIAALSADEFASILELKARIAEVEAEEREMNEIRAEIAAEAAYIEEGIEGDEQAAQADAEAEAVMNAVLGEYVEPTGSHGKIAITKYSANEAIATAAFDTNSIGGHVTRERGRWVLRYGNGHDVIRAKTLGKVAKLWARNLSFYATTITVETMS